MGREHAGFPRPSGIALRAQLDRALDEGMAALPDIARARRDTGWGEAEVQAYLRGFNYRLGGERGQGHRGVHPAPRVHHGARAMLRQIRERALAGKRLDRAEGHWLLTEAPLLDLGSVAQEARFQRIPDKRVTFVIDSNPNYTNVCITDCQFCAFYRKPGDKEAWTLTVEEVMAKVDSRPRAGRDDGAPAGRAQPRPAPRLLPVAGPRNGAPLPRRHPALLHRVRDLHDRGGVAARRCPRSWPSSRRRA